MADPSSGTNDAFLSYSLGDQGSLDIVWFSFGDRDRVGAVYI